MTEERLPTDDTPALPADSQTDTSSKTKTFLGRFVWSILKVPLYLVFLIGTVVGGLWVIEKIAQFALGRTFYASVYPQRLWMARNDYTRPTPHYDYDFTPGVCLELNINKGNRYDYANNAGFRYPQDITLRKPPDEFRIFLTGGSTAFGMGATGHAAPAMDFYSIEYRETIAHVLEQILNTTAPIPGKRIRVYNTAVWGYAYQHLLNRYVAKLRRYKPDLIVSLDGANELPMICRLTEDWNYFEEGQYNNILREIFRYEWPGLASYLTLWLKNNTYFVTYLWTGKDLFQELSKDAFEATLARSGGIGAAHPDPSKTSAAESAEMLSQRADENVGTVVRIVENYHSVMENDGVPHIIALQPWFWLSKKPRSEKEKILEQLQLYKDYYGVPSDKMYKLLIDKIIESAQNKGYFVVDFSGYFDDVSEWVFTDWCHLTAEANYLIAKELANLIKEHFFRMPLSDSDKIDDKMSFFYDLAVSGKLVYAPPSESPATRVENMLSGYPSDQGYVSKIVAEKEPLEIVLDLEESHLVSRLRLVWGDEASVPKRWVVEASEDKVSWKPFVESGKGQTDSFSRWPGFEYYAATPIKGRYFRYRPLETHQRTIKLRCWNLAR